MGRRRSHRDRPESLAEIEYRRVTGKIMSKPTFYKGRQMRSKLEVRFAWHLDLIGEKWAYEPRPFGTRGHGYLPDFEILDGVRPAFIEVKPTLKEVEAAQRKMSVIWDVHPDALLMVACAEGCTWFASSGGDWTSWLERWAHE